MDESNARVHVLAYANYTYGWKLDAENILKFRVTPTGFRGIFDRGVKGCPVIEVSEQTLNAFLDQLERDQEEKPVAVAVFTQVPGITSEIEAALYDLGVYNYEDLRAMAFEKSETLLGIKGLGPATLQRIRDYLGEDVSEELTDPEDGESEEQSDPEE